MCENEHKDNIKYNKYDLIVVSVKDNDDLIKDLEERRAPAMIVFALPEDDYILLKKASYLRTYDSTLIPVPTNESLKDEPGDVEVASDELKDKINEWTVWTGE